MSRQFGPFHRSPLSRSLSLSFSLSYPSNLQRKHSVNFFSDLTFSPLPVFNPIYSTFSHHSSHKPYDDSIQTVFDIHNSLNNPAKDNPDCFIESEPSPTSTTPDTPKHMTLDQLDLSLDDFIQQHQQIHNTALP